MKTYKTWEVMKMLSENPKLKFEQRDEENTVVRISISRYGYIKFDNENCSNELDGNILIDEKWTLFQEPVDFMTAIKAFKEGKPIKCEFNDDIFIYCDKKSSLLECDGFGIGAEEILYGKWYIEEGENNEAPKQTANSETKGIHKIKTSKVKYR